MMNAFIILVSKMNDEDYDVKCDLEGKSKMQQLYKRFHRILERWPKQENRKVRFITQLESSFDKQLSELSSLPPPELDGKIQLVEKDMELLESLLENSFEQKYPIDQNNPILAYLPSEKTYSLLDNYAQQVMQKENTFSFFRFNMRQKFNS